MRLKVEQPIAQTSGTLCAPKLQGALCKSMADNTESKKSNGQTAVKGPGKSTAESSKPITMFLHQEDRIRELFKGLKIADCSRLNASIEEEEESAELDNVPRDPLVVSEVMTCSHCGVGFSDRPEQVGHYKSDFHKYNVKRSAGGQTALTERQFDRLDIDDDVLSLSGSDSEEDSDEDTLSEREEGSTSASASEETPARRRRRRADDDRELQRNQLRRHTKLFLVNADRQMFCLYKCLIMSKWAPAGDTQVELAVKQLARGLRVGVFLLSGGHFAAAVFSGGKAVLHKTFHSYTVRAKQGGGQASRDARSATKQPRSAGASLRRYNEASLVQHIQELLASWEEEVSRCSLLFVRALGSGAAALYGGKAPPLNRRDPRIRSVPFPTRRPTFAELERVYQALTCVHVYGTDVDVNLSQVPQSPPKPETPARTPRRSPRPERPPAERSGPPTAPPPGRRITARDRRNSERQQDLERSLSVTDSEGSDSESAEYEVRQMRGLTDLSSFSPEEGFDSSRPLDDRVVTAVEERRRRREFRRRLREEQRAAEAGEEAKKPVDDGGQKMAAANTTEVPEEPPEPAGAEEFRVQCYTLCKTGDAAGLDALLTEPLVPLTALLSRSFGQTSQTLLHAAARAGHSALVSRLLEVGADPTLRDGAGQTPYDVSSARETRNQFRRYRAAHPDKHNYAKAHIPAPLTEEMEAEKKQRDAEKKKLQNQKRKEKMKEKKAQQLIEEAARKEKEKEEEEKRRFLQLSDREKRALAAERRMAAQQSGRPLVRCCHCGEDITGRVPFEYSGRLLCSTACVRQHRAATAGAGTAA